MRRSLTRDERLKARKDVKRVFQSRSKVNVSGAKLLLVPNGLDRNRICVSLVRKYGNAVQRNRAKRQIREIFRTEKTGLRRGFDFAVVLFPGDFAFEDRKEQLLALWKKAGMYEEST